MKKYQALIQKIIEAGEKYIKLNITNKFQENSLRNASLSFKNKNL